MLDGLAVRPGDEVLAIAASGDNPLALLLADPRRVVAVDLSPAQIALCELKIAALRTLDYPELLGYLGLAPHRRRLQLHQAVRDRLPAAVRPFWDGQRRAIERGVIHAGKLERYFAHFRRFVLPLVHLPATVQALLRPRTLAEQEAFYREVWDTPRWRLLFRLFFSRALLGRLGRDPEFFRYVETHRVGEEILARTRAGLTRVPVAENPFVHYIVTGRYHLPQGLPLVWRADSVRKLRDRLDRLELVQDELERLLPRLPAASFDAFYLSDLFEYVGPPAMAELLQALLRVARPGARALWWSLLAPRPVPAGLAKSAAAAGLPPAGFVGQPELAERLRARAGTFFYGGVNVERVA